MRCERLELRSDADAREGGAQLPTVLPIAAACRCTRARREAGRGQPAAGQWGAAAAASAWGLGMGGERMD